MMNRSKLLPLGFLMSGILVCLMIGVCAGGISVMGQQPKGRKSMVKKKFVNPKTLPKSGSYSHLVIVKGGKTVYISGQVSQNAEGEIVGKGDLRSQIMQTFQNLKNALAEVGAAFSDVIKINIYVVNYREENLAVIREVRSRFVSAEKPPASTLVGVESLFHEDLLIEIEAIAVID